jgi:cytochrome bd ubiquinol oxidase subunit II
MIPAELAGQALWLPLIFMALMGLAMLAYVILDGYDLGVGILLPLARTEAERDTMIASIGPFWDANETWLVLGVGLLLVAFPQAHGLILTNLYLPVAFMLAGLILRGVAFDFRVKARAAHKPLWDRAFFAGSLLASLAQGVMLGGVVTGFDHSPLGMTFALLIGAGLAGGYTLLGAGWLLMKTEGALQQRAVRWAHRALWASGAGILAVSLATPLVSPQIFAKWFSFPNVFALAPIPLMTATIFGLLLVFLARLRQDARQGNEQGLARWAWAPFTGAVGLFLLAFFGLAYSLFPYLVLDRLTIWEAASAPESLRIILWGVLIVLPTIIAYTVWAYRVFWGKAQALSYES